MATHAKAAKLSPTERLAVYGGIAATIRAAMEAKGLTAATLNEALGYERGYALIYQYINGKSAPSALLRPKLAKVLDVPESALLKAPLGDARQAGDEPSTALVRLPAPTSGRSTDVLSFAIQPDGTARLRVDMTTTAERGVAMLRLLLDAGLIVSVQ